MASRPKPPISLWIAAERKRHDWKVDELSRRLRDMGYEAEVGTIRVWEAGRSPRAETIEALERLFGSSAPRQAERPDAEVAAALVALNETLALQAEVMRELLVELRENREATAGRAAGMAAALGELSGTLESLRPLLAGKSR